MANKTAEEIAQPGETENAAIGCILISPECWEELPEFTVSHCYSDRNRAILTSVERLRELDNPIDAVTISEDLANHGALSDIGGTLYIHQLMESAPQAAHFSYYAGQVIDRRRRAGIKRKLERGIEALSDGEPIDKALLELDFSEESTGESRFEFLDAKGLSEGDFPIEYLVNGVLVKGQPCIIAAPKKCLKTNTLIELGFCLATGNRFLGKFDVPNACNVGIMSGESGPGTLKETFNRIVKSHGWNPQYVDGFHICFELPSIEDQLDIMQIKRVIKEKELDVLIIDPAYLCLSLGESASNLFSVGDRLKELTKLGQETDSTIILVHHTRKSNGQNTFAEPELEEISMAGFQEWARQWILLNRREAYKPDNPGVHKLWFVTGGSDGHSESRALDINEGSIEDADGRVWETRLFSSKEARAEKTNETERKKETKKESQFKSDVEKALKALGDLGGEATKSKIKNKAGLSTDKTEQALFYLVDGGMVVEAEIVAGNKQKYSGYKLSRDHSGSLGIPNGPECQDTHSVHSLPVRESVPSECESDEGRECVSEKSIPSDFSDIFPTDSNGEQL